MNLEQLFEKYKCEQLYGRYITNTHIEPSLNQLKPFFEIDIAGYSVLEKPIYSIKAGTGKNRILIWSQMHGNESTTTKAIFDMLNFLKSDEEIAYKIKSEFTFYILPIVNPDGAANYTRENANKTDLNRDAANLSEPESKVLRESFNSFKPHYCYNMHDQRTIFGLLSDNDRPKPATVSFLAPAYNVERSVNSCRQKAINLIVAMNTTLQNYIPGQVGRFDDSYNQNCVGDSFQSLGVPTILFEAGHYDNDYEREETRKFIFYSLIDGFTAIYENVIVVSKNDEYFNIPQNKAVFYDFLYKNANINYESKEKIAIFASQYKEVLIDNSVTFSAIIKEINNEELYYGHKEYDLKGGVFSGNDGSSKPEEGMPADFTVAPGRQFINGTEVI